MHTVVHRAILPRTFVRVRLYQRRTRTKVCVRVRVRRRPTVLDFFVRRTRVVRACFIQMGLARRSPYELALLQATHSNEVLLRL